MGNSFTYYNNINKFNGVFKTLIISFTILVAVIVTLIIIIMFIKNFKSHKSNIDKIFEIAKEKIEELHKQEVIKKEGVKCSYCGTRIKENDDRCPNCGAQRKK